MDRKSLWEGDIPVEFQRIKSQTQRMKEREVKEMASERPLNRTGSM